MSHALLLRLFLAPSFFSVHVALQYLKTYPDNIGITHYLTGRLREFDLKELEDVWGFIWSVSIRVCNIDELTSHTSRIATYL